tara:strand:+ start:106 stop:876 length:771 start_codon:yes stop_codon:yes gene_type:complete
MITQKLKFSDNSKQAKLKNIPIELAPNRSIWSFNLPSGFSCPGAKKCLSKADKITGKITDGKDTLFRCFSASDEARSTQARAQRWHNFTLLRQYKNANDIAMLINQSLPSVDIDVIRIHVSGDFYSLAYFIAWIKVAKDNRNIRFYAYTKSINYWVHCIDKKISIPSNLILNASRGGRYDKLINDSKYQLKSAEVVFSLEQAEQRGLQIDHNDSLAMTPGPNFANLLHGTQPIGSVASKALRTLREKNTKYSYSRV